MKRLAKKMEKTAKERDLRRYKKTLEVAGLPETDFKIEMKRDLRVKKRMFK